MSKENLEKFVEMMKTLTEDQQKELEELLKESVEEAKKVKQDYVDNPSEISGSVISIHQDSPFVDERVPDDANWKHVITAPHNEVLQQMDEHNKKVKENKKTK
jgi:translation initiation factor 2B subunit (eIF-2B alpha/beta/delta family)